MKVRERRYASGLRRWQIDIAGVGPDGATFRKRLQAPESVTSKSGAQRWGEEQRRRLERGETPATPRATRKASRTHEAAVKSEVQAQAPAVVTIAQACAWYVEDAMIERLSPSSIDLRRRLCNDHVSVVLGGRAVHTLGQSDLADFARHIEPLSHGFARLLMRTLRAVLDSARRRGVAHTVEIRLPKVRVEDEPRAYDATNFEAMVSAAAEISPAHLAVILLAGEAALRRGEILGLRVGDARLSVGGMLKIKRQIVRVAGVDIERPPKGDKARTVPLSPRLVAVLLTLAGDRGDDERLLLTSDGSRPATENTVRAFVYRVQRRCGLPEVGPHAARHTALSHMLASGTDVRVVQKVAGHARLETGRVAAGHVWHFRGTCPQTSGPVPG